MNKILSPVVIIWGNIYAPYTEASFLVWQNVILAVKDVFFYIQKLNWVYARVWRTKKSPLGSLKSSWLMQVTDEEKRMRFLDANIEEGFIQ